MQLRRLRGQNRAWAAVLLSVTLSGGAWGMPKEKVLHSFAGGRDGWGPQAGLIFDKAGSLYGTTVQGGGKGCGGGGCGTVFKLTRGKHGWRETILYRFRGGLDGEFPVGGLIMDGVGSLFGTTTNGGRSSCDYGGWTGCGTVFQLTHTGGAWRETVLHSFAGGDDGIRPLSTLTLDPAGNLYGTTFIGGKGCGDGGCGTVFELSPTGQGWTETVLYSFALGSDGYFPGHWVVVDSTGNLYGTTGAGGNDKNCGTVFELSPGSEGWLESVLYDFCGADHDGAAPLAGLTFGKQGVLYGTTYVGESSGTVFQLAPRSGGGWTETVLYTFRRGRAGAGPVAGVILDDAGNLYGTTEEGGRYGQGAAYKLKPTAKGWRGMPLHDFSGGRDGKSPLGNLVFDRQGNLYGTTALGGAHKMGVVFQLEH